MLEFLKNLKQKLIAENERNDFLVYIIRELPLLIIGIFIALQINSKYEKSKSKDSVEIFETNLTYELIKDLDAMNTMDSLNRGYKSSILNYLNYYNTANPDIDILVEKLDSIVADRVKFFSSTNTFQDLINSENLSNLSEEKRNAIIEIKNVYNYVSYDEQRTAEELSKYTFSAEKELDLLYRLNFSPKEHVSAANWKCNLNSEEYLSVNNWLARSMSLYNYQDYGYCSIVAHVQFLLNLLEIENTENLISKSIIDKCI